jgi:hypothetical protein
LFLRVKRKILKAARAFFVKIVKGPGPVHFVKKSAIYHKFVKKNNYDILLGISRHFSTGNS